MNWLEPEQTIAPTFLPVSLGEVRDHLRLDDTSEDALLLGYLMGAVTHIEAFTGLRLATQTVKLRADGFRCSRFGLARPPLQSVTKIEYVDTAGATQELATSVYAVYAYGLSPEIALKPDQSWPSTRLQADAVTITAVVGYAQNALPDPIRVAVLLICGDMFEGRVGEAATGTKLANELLVNFRVYSL